MSEEEYDRYHAFLMRTIPRKKSLVAGFLILSLWVLRAPGAVHSANLPLDSPVYRLLDRMWAEGRIDGYWPDTLPLSAAEARELAAGAPEVLALLPFDSGLELRPYFGIQGGSEGFSGANAGGLTTAAGGLAGLRMWAARESFSAFGNLRLSREGDDRRLPEFHGQIRVGRLVASAGRETRWWGPGRRGDLILTDNAPAPDGLSLRTWPGFYLPWVFRHIGETRVHFFLSRLTAGQLPGAVPDPLFGGLKVSISPHRNLILSLARTFLYGGEGRDESLQALVDALLARDGSEGDANVIGNQIASLLAVWRCPSTLQPAVLYGEAAGEDEANYQPSKWGFLAGVYLPRLGKQRRMDLRVEAASTDMPGHDSVWYRHNDYPYVQGGRILGHAMGNDAHDLYLEVGLYPRARSRLSFSFTRTHRGVSFQEEQIMTGLGMRAQWWGERSALGVELKSESWDHLPELAEDGQRLAVMYEFTI